MNCDFNEVAYVVRSSHGDSCTKRDIGTPVETKTLALTPRGPVWRFSKARQCQHCGGWRDGYFDADLQPMRPKAPEKKAEDVRPPTGRELEKEMLEWLGIGA